MELTAEDVKITEEIAAMYQQRVARATNPEIRAALLEGAEMWRRVARANGVALRLADRDGVA